MHTVKGLEAADAVQSPARWKVPEFRAHVLDDARRTLEGSCRKFRRVSTHACRCRRGRQLAQFSNTPPTETQISRRGTEPRLQAAWIDGPARPSPERPGAAGDPERGPSHNQVERPRAA